jgi:hypothetical protein
VVGTCEVVATGVVVIEVLGGVVVDALPHPVRRKARSNKTTRPRYNIFTVTSFKLNFLCPDCLYF